MNPTEMQRLAHAIDALRPDWPIASLRTFIERNLASRSYRDAAVALAWVATDTKPDGTPASDTPKRVLEAGPWWRAAAIENPETLKSFPPRSDQACRTCGRWLHECICGERAVRPPQKAREETRKAALEQMRATLSPAPAVVETEQEDA